jgi:hypothetical protein
VHRVSAARRILRDYAAGDSYDFAGD